MYHFDCRYFTGYKPCQFKRGCRECPHYDAPEQRVIVVSLEALGAVLRSTCLLPALKRQYPKCHITWLTLNNAAPLLQNNPFVDRLLILNDQNLAVLDCLSFDSAYIVDKSMLAGAIGQRLHARAKFGFGLNQYGAIVPLTTDADYQYQVGLDDDLKFFRNQKPETQQITETMGLSWQRDPYVLTLNDQERGLVREHRTELLEQSKAVGIIGFSTGCSVLYPYKKFTVSKSIEVISRWRAQFPGHAVAIYGGREDQARNLQMKQAFEDDSMVVLTPTDQGLRSGIRWMATADVMLTGCSLGLHISIALQRPTITWFGVSCSQEIDLYGLGAKIQADVTCSPCWKKSCEQSRKCYDHVSVDQIMLHTEQLLGLNK